MSMQHFNGKVFRNGNTGAAASLRYGEYIIKLGVIMKGSRKVATKEVGFALSGPAAATEAELDEAASIMAGRLAKLDDGVIMNFYKKLGKYRNDEQPKVITPGSKSWGKIIQSNNPKVEDPDSIEDMPLDVKSLAVFIPHLNDTTSRQDMVATVSNPIQIDDKLFHLSTSRFDDAAKTSISVYPLEYNAGATSHEYRKAPTFQLVPNDTVIGDSDGVTSETPHVVVPGEDDQESMVIN